LEHINKIGVVLLNLGGPDSIQAVRPFLFNLFSDRDIIRLGPPFLQKPLAWYISGSRSKKTEQMYNQIGGKSPILDITMSQAEALEKALNQGVGAGLCACPSEGQPHRVVPTMNGDTLGVNFKVYIGMRYWHPFVKDTLDQIIHDGIEQLIVLSLYPHYSKATTGSAIADFKKAVAELQITNYKLRIQYIDRWYDFPPYIDSLAELISEGMKEFEGKDFDLLYSAHSLPQSFIDEGDLYLEHINATIAAINLLLDTRNSLPVKWHLSFQSKTGPVKWLEPSTGDTIIRLAKEGCKNLFVVPISFVSDHIETLYEIDILYKKLAEAHGLYLARCRSLNTYDKFILAMKQLIMGKM
jgi:ferrochelatase